MKPSVLVYDPYPDEAWAASLRAAIGGGIEVTIPPDTDAADAALPRADVVIATGRRHLGPTEIARMARATGVVCFSIGMDQVDAPAAAAAGIEVTNIPDYCTDDVADHAIALLLAAQRRLVPLANQTAAGTWTGKGAIDVGTLRRLRGRTLGLVGFGRIGRAVAERARPFGLRIVASDPAVPAGTAPSVELVSLEELAGRADAVVLCAALTPGSRGIIGEAFLSRVQPGLVLVNVARGGLVDEAALVAALDDGRVAVAALDVRAVEPPDPATDPLAGRPDVLVTPHAAGSSLEAFDDLLVKTASVVRRLLATERAGALG
jgi:D-3-phosphoglycerate dehydrogenase / 2-oxoglutarate reductase